MKIGVIGAMDQELVPIRGIVQDLECHEKGGRAFWHGRSHGHDIYLTRCDPGKVNAAIAAQQMMDYFGVDVLFNMGASGALDPRLEVGDLVIATEFIQHDFDLTNWGMRPGELLFDIVMDDGTGQMRFRSQQAFHAHAGLAQAAMDIARSIELVPLNGHFPKTYTGRVLSGDQFISETDKARALWDTHQALCTDMESAAIAHVCEVNGIPLLCIRAISDKADHSAVVSFKDFLAEATSNYGRIFEIAFQRIGEVI
ncbi:MAG: 5'-methylthioadenosine/adenosylhomocysteine nucleosidase [Chloroflexota bacterium]